MIQTLLILLLAVLLLLPFDTWRVFFSRSTEGGTNADAWSRLSSSTGAATTDVINMFRYTYGEERLQYLAAQEIVLYKILSKRKSPVGGRGQWIIPLQTQNAGVWVGNAE